MITLNTNLEKKVVLQCLKASLDEKIFPDWEFNTLFGLSKKEVANIVANWEHVDISDENIQLAINNAFTNLLGYPHGQEKILESLLGISCEELAKMFDEIRK